MLIVYGNENDLLKCVPQEGPAPDEILAKRAVSMAMAMLTACEQHSSPKKPVSFNS